MKNLVVVCGWCDPPRLVGENNTRGDLFKLSLVGHDKIISHGVCSTCYQAMFSDDTSDDGK